MMRLPKKLSCSSCLFACTLVYCSLYAQPSKKDSVSFKKVIITSEFVSEGAAVGDVNHDGKMDIMAGAFWFEAPGWAKHEIDEAKTFNPDTTYSNSFLNFSMDVDQDGWIDFVRVGFPGKETVWYKNPANKPGHWKMYMICENTGNESPMLGDVDGDGRLDFICNNPVTKQVLWYKSPVVKGDTAWRKFIISQGELATYVYTHGLGLGDINGDGRKDVIIAKGWWEAAVDRTQPNWVFHPADISQECSEMFTIDLNNDGKTDIISASAHDYGVWWQEQVRGASGIGFLHHKIDSSFSETHGLALKDVNGDGNPDIVTGKRWYAHNGNDRGGKDPAVIYWYEYKPGKQPQWVSHFIDDNSGVGLHVVVQDMNKDGLADIVIGNKKGVFLFEQQKEK